MKNVSPILVTGSHRSGTTWVGRTIAYAEGTAYVHEPFNPDSDRGYCAANFPGQYTYVGEHNRHVYSDAFDDTVALRYRPLARLRSQPTLRSIAAAAVRWPLFTWYRIRNMRPVLKDPIALFSAPWIHEEYDATVIVMIRHPAAFASSLKSRNWIYPMDFKNLLGQPELLVDHLSAYRREITDAARSAPAPLDEAILSWNVFYSVVHQFLERYPDWIAIRHEDISSTPVESFERLYDRLGLDLTASIRDRISADTDSGEGAGQFDTRRDSRTNITRWKRTLSEEEIVRVRQETSDVWTRFYDDSDW